MLVSFPDISVEITDDVLLVFDEYTQIHGRNEAGGILLGKYIPEKEYYVISVATKPTDKDNAGPLWFSRNRDAAQQIINVQWDNSDGLINYMGEWHTHPWKNPTPSSVDKSLMKKVIRDGSNVWKHLFMIIVGLEGSFYLGVCDTEHKGKIIHERIIGG